jgi:hypothetical protein
VVVVLYVCECGRGEGDIERTREGYVKCSCVGLKHGVRLLMQCLVSVSLPAHIPRMGPSELSLGSPWSQPHVLAVQGMGGGSVVGLNPTHQWDTGYS